MRPGQRLNPRTEEPDLGVESRPKVRQERSRRRVSPKAHLYCRKPAEHVTPGLGTDDTRLARQLEERTHSSAAGVSEEEEAHVPSLCLEPMGRDLPALPEQTEHQVDPKQQQ